MLKMMAADNDDAYAITPSFILETVLAAKLFIGKEKSYATDGAKGRIEEKISKFINWPKHRVRNALAQLSAIEKNELSKEAVKPPSTSCTR